MKNRASYYFVMLFLLMPLFALAGQTVWQKAIYKSHIFIGSQMIVKDLTSADETSGNNGYYGASRTGLVTLVYGREGHSDVYNAAAWSYKIIYDVKFNGSGGSEQTFFDQELLISFAGSAANHVIEDLNVYEGVPSNASVTITDIVSTGTVPTDVRLEIAIAANKVRHLNYLANDFLFNYEATINDIELHWDYFPGAESYELEWVFVDQDDPNLGMFHPSSSPPVDPFEYYDAVRVTTSNQFYKISRTYPTGWFFFRLRPVGFFTEFISDGNYTFRKNGPWITNFNNGSASSVAFYENYLPFEHGKTWQSVVTYAEQGKSKEVVTYYDGSSRNRQTVVNLNTDGTVIVSETKYDYEGRPVVQILPTPIAGTALSFKTDFTKNGAGNIYSAADFDIAASPGALSSSTGAGKYYSPSNDLSNSLSHIPNFDYIPSASGYPFTQVRYMRDNSGRVERSSGLGEDHVLYGGHDVRYYYTGVSSTELHRLFGENVGDARFYKKIISVDPNGQASVAYQDNTGKTIATSLLGESPNNVQSLSLDAPATRTVTLQGNNVHDPSTNTWTVTYPKFNEVPNNIHTFSYNAYAQINGMIGGASRCFDCKYSFTFYIEGPDGQRIDLYDITGNGPNYNATDKILTMQYGPGCGSTPDPHSDLLGIKASFDDIGTYTIYKVLRLLPPSFDDVSLIAELSSTVVPAQEIVDSYVENFNYANCNITCDQKCGNLCPGVDCDECMLSCLQAESNAFNEAVDYLATNSCEGYYTAMIEQIRPGGYYFENEDASNGSDAFWELLESSGKIGQLTDFDNIILGYSDIEDVEDNWETYGEHWIEQHNLIQQHPEFCIYSVKCLIGAQLMQDAKEYEARMFSIPNWTVASTSGYLAPYTSSAVTVTYGSQTINISADGNGNSQDPTTTYSSGSSSFINYNLYSLIYGKLYDYKNGYSLWEFTDKDCAAHGGALYGAIDVSDPDEYSKWRWFIFRAMYIDLREEVFNQVIIGLCGGGEYNDEEHGYLANQMEAVFKYRGYTDDPTDGVLIDLIDDATTADFNITCQGQVDVWLGNIKSYLFFNRSASPCMPSNAISDADFVTWWASVENGIETRLAALCNDNTLPRNIWGIPIIDDGILASKPTSGTIPAYLAAQGCTLTCASLAQSSTCGIKVSTWMGDIYAHCTSLDPSQTSTDYITIKGYLESYCETYSNVLNSEIEITVKQLFTNADLIDLQTYLAGKSCTETLNDVSSTIVQPTACLSAMVDYINTYVLPASPPTPPATVSPCFDVDKGLMTSIGILSGELLLSFSKPLSCHGLYLFDKCGTPISWVNINNIEEIVYNQNLPFSLSGYRYDGASFLIDIDLPYTYSCDPTSPSSPIVAYVLEFVSEVDGKSCAPPLIEEVPRESDLNWADTWHTHCREMMQEIAVYQAQQEYQRLLDEAYTQYLNGRQCTPNEEFSMTCKFQEYHHTLYYYDQSGHLVQTVPPEGVAYLDGTTYFNADGSFKHGNNYYPLHRMPSKYKYNSIGQVIHQETPDGGETNFWYNKASQLRFSQNSKQQPNNEYSYTNYDRLGRITEAGKIVEDPNYLLSSEWLLPRDLTVYQGGKRELVMTSYGGGPNGRNRVSSVSAVDFGYSLIYQPDEFFRHITNTSYTYDVQGNVKSLTQELGSMEGLGNVKRINYEYDLISGNVHKVRYQQGEADEFNHRYRYDADNRLTSVSTSKDGWMWEEDARYFYYPHGPLARVEIGQDKLQGLDYYYTIHGWLKGINTPGGDHTASILGTGPDPGQDGYLGSGNQDRWTGRDEFALGLGYYSGDYNPIAGSGWAAGTQESPWTSLSGDIMGTGLFNGNIAWMQTEIPQMQRQGMGTALEAYAFKYDQLHRIKQGKRWQHDGTAWGNTNEWRYHTNYAYDKNGNLNTLQRHRDDGTLIDNLSYNYQASGGHRANNKLRYVADAVSSGTHAGDIDNQPVISGPGTTTYNYGYDGIGNLIKDVAEDIEEIVWNVQGKIREIRFGSNGKPDLEFIYDGMGQRVAKISKPKEMSGAYRAPDKWVQTWYVRDASGNVMATYETNFIYLAQTQRQVKLTETPIYGSSRLGLVQRDVVVSGYQATKTDKYFRKLGQKMYELSNHLGNVNAVISDVRIGVDEYTFSGGAYTTMTPDGFADYYRPKVVSATDYYPFGWTLPNRSFNSGDYRFGFQGQETDREYLGGAIFFKYRVHDPRLGRFLSVDPLSANYPGNSSYAFSENRVIDAIELEGAESRDFRLSIGNEKENNEIWEAQRKARELCNCETPGVRNLRYAVTAGLSLFVAVPVLVYGGGTALTVVSNPTVLGASVGSSPLLMRLANNPQLVGEAVGLLAGFVDPNPTADYSPGPGNELGSFARKSLNLTLDFFGGKASKYVNALNIDMQALNGFKGTIAEFSGFAKQLGIQVSNIIADNPQASFLSEASDLLVSGGTITIRGNMSNPYFKPIVEGTSDFLENFNVVKGKTQIPNVDFLRTDGTAVGGKIYEIVLERK